MEYVFDNDRPIYIQLVERLRIDIISGRFKVGEKLPSVREFAMMVKVNPNTMQKALAELEKEGLIFTERTNGKFVTRDFKKIEKVRNEIVHSKISLFLDDMATIGMDASEVIEYLNERKR